MSPVTPEAQSRTPPHWPHCGLGATEEDPVGCPGIKVLHHSACLAHLNESDRAAYLATLSPGTDIDHSGTPFTQDLLGQLLDALRDPATGLPCFGAAQFYQATFTHARFSQADFCGHAVFSAARFAGDAMFGGANFAGSVSFKGAIFSGDAWFDRVTFPDTAFFNEAAFNRNADFRLATFSRDAHFELTAFTGDARFNKVDFAGNAYFIQATFAADTWFGGAAFTKDAHFAQVRFAGDADFAQASFAGHTRFDRAAFTGRARFGSVNFAGIAWFHDANFTGSAGYRAARFADDAHFARAAFTEDTRFTEVRFAANADFAQASFAGEADFSKVRFETAGWLGPLVCRGTLDLDNAVFEVPVTVEAAAGAVTCRRTRWATVAKLSLRYAQLDLRNAVLEFPLTVAARPIPFLVHPGDFPVLEEVLDDDRDPGVQLMGLDGTDAALVVLLGIDLSLCEFAGAVHLDQLRVDGWCTFATTPSGGLLRWWTRRSTLVEEHHWRSANVRHPARSGWTPGLGALPPATLAALYRHLRKSLEDGKNEPDAADFYYGEMEMRRHDKQRPRGERALLTAYWALSGYGLRASRALVWLLSAMATTILVLLLWGLPTEDPRPTTTGRQAAPGQEITWVTDTPDPINPTGPLADRFTGDRFEKALRTVVNSVVFRSSDQELTTVGTYTEMACRFTEPILLGMAALAVRNRVKR